MLNFSKQAPRHVFLEWEKIQVYRLLSETVGLLICL